MFSSAIRIAFEKMLAGKYWFYLLPGLLLSLLFWETNVHYYDFEDFSKEYFENEGFWDKIGRFFTYVSRAIYLFIALTVLSPVYCLLSEKVDADLTGQHFDFSWYTLIRDTLRAFFSIILVYFIIFFIKGAWFLIALIFGINDINKFIYLALDTILFGFALFDYSMERYKINVFSSFSFVFQNKLSCLFLGIIFSVLLLIPYVGAFFSPFFTTIIGTIVYLYKTNKITTLET